MDREISKDYIKRRRRKKIFLISSIISGVIISVFVLSILIEDSFPEDQLNIRKADRGEIESSISASGKVVPLYEQAITSPVATKILEIYHNEGDNVEAGESLLKLDIRLAEKEVRQAKDEAAMKGISVKQTSIDNSTYLTDLQMRIKTKEMEVEHLKTLVANEKRLDSIGSGTGERIQEAELAYRKSLLELDQMKVQLKNETKSHEATLKSKQLEREITLRNLSELTRTLDDAKVKAPKNGIITYLNSNLGESIGAGERLAVIADLSHFKIKGEIPEGHLDRVTPGAKVNVRVNKKNIEGKIGNISPQSKDGMVEFTVILNNDSALILRPGLRAELNVVYDIHADVVRIPTGSYYQGPGNYYLFVKTSEDKIEKRNIILGDNSFDYVEVKDGIKPGEDVVITDMSDYSKRNKIRLKKKEN